MLPLKQSVAALDFECAAPLSGAGRFSHHVWFDFAGATEEQAVDPWSPRQAAAPAVAAIRLLFSTGEPPSTQTGPQEAPVTLALG